MTDDSLIDNIFSAGYQNDQTDRSLQYLQEENNRLNQTNIDLLNQIKSLKEHFNKNVDNSKQYEELLNENKNIKKENNQLKLDYGEISERLKIAIRQSNQTKAELQAQIDEARSEIEPKKQKLENEIKSLKLQLLRAKSQSESVISEYEYLKLQVLKLTKLSSEVHQENFSTIESYIEYLNHFEANNIKEKIENQQIFKNQIDTAISKYKKWKIRYKTEIENSKSLKESYDDLQAQNIYLNDNLANSKNALLDRKKHVKELNKLVYDQNDKIKELNLTINDNQNQIDDLTKQVASLSDKSGDINKQNRELQKQNADLTSKKQELEHLVSEYEMTISELNKEKENNLFSINELSKQNKSLHKQVNDLNRRCRELVTQNSSLDRRINYIENQNTSLQSKNIDYVRQIKDLNKVNTELTKNMDEDYQSITPSVQTVDDLMMYSPKNSIRPNQELFEMQSKLKKKKDKVHMLKSELHDKNQTLIEIENRYKEIEKECMSLRNQTKDAHTDLNKNQIDFESELNKYKENSIFLSAQINSLKITQTDLEAELGKTKTTMQELEQSNINLLRDNEQIRESYEELLKEKNNLTLINEDLRKSADVLTRNNDDLLKEYQKYKEDVERELNITKENYEKKLITTRDEISRQLTKEKDDLEKRLIKEKDEVERKLNEEKDLLSKELLKERSEHENELKKEKRIHNQDLIKKEEEYEKDISKFSEEIIKINNDYIGTKSELDKTRDDFSKTKQQLIDDNKSLQKIIKKKDASINSLKQKFEKLIRSLATVDKDLRVNQKQNELKSTQIEKLNTQHKDTVNLLKKTKGQLDLVQQKYISLQKKFKIAFVTPIQWSNFDIPSELIKDVIPIIEGKNEPPYKQLEKVLVIVLDYIKEYVKSKSLAVIENAINYFLPLKSIIPDFPTIPEKVTLEVLDTFTKAISAKLIKANSMEKDAERFCKFFNVQSLKEVEEPLDNLFKENESLIKNLEKAHKKMQKFSDKYNSLMDEKDKIQKELLEAGQIIGGAQSRFKHQHVDFETVNRAPPHTYTGDNELVDKETLYIDITPGRSPELLKTYTFEEQLRKQKAQYDNIIKEKISEIDNFRMEVAELTTKLKSMEITLQHTKPKIDKANEEKLKARKHIKQLRKLIEDVQKDSKRKKKLLKKKHQQELEMYAAQIKKQTDECSSTISGLRSKLYDLERDNERLSSELTTMQANFKKLEVKRNFDIDKMLNYKAGSDSRYIAQQILRNDQFIPKIK